MGCKQQDTLFTFSVSLDFEPGVEGEETGVSAFLTQNHHFDLGVVMLPARSETASFPGAVTDDGEEEDTEDGEEEEETGGGLVPYFRFRAESYVSVPKPLVVPVPEAWVGETLRLEIAAKNYTHYTFSAGPAARRSEARQLMEASNDALSWGFTGESMLFTSPPSRSPVGVNRSRGRWANVRVAGVILGAYATSNGGEGLAPAYISEWKYVPHEQFRD